MVELHYVRSELVETQILMATKVVGEILAVEGRPDTVPNRMMQWGSNVYLNRMAQPSTHANEIHCTTPADILGRW
jgi:hypothetical protein